LLAAEGEQLVRFALEHRLLRLEPADRHPDRADADAVLGQERLDPDPPELAFHCS